MHTTVLSHLRPSPATAIALAALVFATTGAVVAKADPQVDKDEVTLVTLTGGPVVITPGEMVPIPLNGEPSFTFTQKAGEAVQLILTVDEDRPPPADTGGCHVQTSVYGVDLPLRARVDLFTNQGDPFGEGSDLGGLAAPASDTEIELRAFTSIENCEPETWGISITVTVMTLRN